MHAHPSEVAPPWLLACQLLWEADMGQEEQPESGPAGSPKAEGHTNKNEKTVAIKKKNTAREIKSPRQLETI